MPNKSDNPLKMPSRGVIADTLLLVIAERGGGAIPTTIYEVVADRLGLSEAQRSLKLKTGWPLYKNHIQFARQELVSRGYLDPRIKGVWTLTKEGLAAVSLPTSEATGADAGLSGEDQIRIALEAMLANGGSAATQALYDALEAKMAGKKLSQQGKSSLRYFVNKIAVEQGYVHPYDKAQPEWRITEKGIAYLQGEEPTLKPPSQESVEPVAKPSVSEAEQLAERLLVAATNSKQPAEFEAVLADAFTLLGFRAKQVGGAGDTDVLVEAPLGREAYSVVVDGKTSASGKASNFDLLPIASHRAAHHAKYALVVAPGFSAGGLLGYAKEQKIALVTAADLAEVVRLHEQSPFSLIELEDLFRWHGAPEVPLQNLRAVFENRAKRDELPRILMERIASNYKQGLVEPVTADALFHQLFAHFKGVRYTRETIEATLLVLASPLVGALAKEKAGYSLTMPLETLERRFTALGRRIRED